MIIETWIAVIFLIFMCGIGIICSLGWLATEQELNKCRKELSSSQEEIHYLRGKLIVKTADDFYKEGKKK